VEAWRADRLGSEWSEGVRWRELGLLSTPIAFVLPPPPFVAPIANFVTVDPPRPLNTPTTSAKAEDIVRTTSTSSSRTNFRNKGERCSVKKRHSGMDTVETEEGKDAAAEDEGVEGEE